MRSFAKVKTFKSTKQDSWGFHPTVKRKIASFCAHWFWHKLLNKNRFQPPRRCVSLEWNSSFTVFTREPANALVLTIIAHPFPRYTRPSSPHSCSRRLTASPPCASGASYRGRPCLRGGWACSRARWATAPRVPVEGAPRSAAGWWGWGRGWSGRVDTSHCSTWRGRSRLSRSPAPGLEPAAGWSAGCNRTLEWSDGTGLRWWGRVMVQIQNLLSGRLLQLELCFSWHRLVTCVETLPRVFHLEKAERVI